MYGEPAQAEVRDEASGFAAYLAYYRKAIGDGVLGLSLAEQRTTRLASGWTPIELLSHVLHMEQRWFVWGFLGEDVDHPWGDWNREEPWDEADEGPEPRWVVPDDVTVESLVSRLGVIGERTTELLGEHDLDEMPPPGPRWDDGEIPTLRWICFHVLQEYARHAGHLDIAVELADTDSSAD
jgi:hypothetical protein